jgi:HK97 family phage major capsid protein
MTPEETKQLNDKLSEIQTTIHDKVEREGEKKAAEFKGMIERMREDVQSKEDAVKMAEDVKKLADGFEAFESKFSRPQGDPVAEEKKLQSSGLRNWFSKGHKGMSPDELKTLTAEDDPQAGYLLLPPYLETEIVDQALQEISPMRRVASVRQISTNLYELPSKTAHAAASWVIDGGTTSEDTTLAYGLESIPVHQCTVLYKARQTLLDDSAFNLETELRQEFGDAFAKLESTAFFTGTGIGQPEGITANATLIANDRHSTSSGAVVASTLMDLWGDLKTAYHANAVFTMRRATMVDLMQLTDGDGSYMLRRLGELPQWVLLGHPVVECADMPAVGADAYAIAFGDFKRGYRIIDRVGIRVIRDPYTSKTTGVVEFMADRRVGGAVINPEAIKLYVLSA